MSSMNQNPERHQVVVGVDTHKHVHAAVALDGLGARLGAKSFPADAAGYRQLVEWAESFAAEPRFGVEGTGSWGAGLAAAIRHRGLTVIEVARPNRADRRLRGKSDGIDAENAARAVIAGTATAVPKSADGAVEAIRTVKAAKDGAVKARSAAMTSLKQALVNVPAELREQLQPLTPVALVRRCAALRPGQVADPASAAKHALKALARRWQALDEEAKEHGKILAGLTAAHAPELAGAFGIGPDSTAEMLIAAGDNPERLRSEAAFAKLCGVCPIPASSGKTNRHRLNRGGNRQANAALHRAVVVRLQYHEPTKSYLAKRLSEGKTKREAIRCLKRHLAREIWRHLRPLRETRTTTPLAA